MMKKTIFFILCLAPLGAQAANVVPEPVPGAAYTGGEITNPSGATFDDGIDVTRMVIGQTVSESEPDFDTVLWVGDIANDEFTILSNADISVSGALTIADGYVLGLGVGSVPGNPTINMSFGSINAGGNLTVVDANAFKVGGTVNIADGFSLRGNSVTTGAFTVTGGVVNIDVDAAAQISDYSNVGTGTTTIVAESINVNGTDGIENAAGAGDMTLTATGDAGVGNITVAGSISNSSDAVMNISAGGDINVAGSIKNDSNSGTFKVVNADNFTVSGNGNGGASFVNAGNVDITVTGTTKLVYGFDLSAMGVDNTFDLTTGSLIMGDGTDEDTGDLWAALFSNKLNSFSVNVTNSDLNIASAIVNGLANDSTDAPVYNTNATMNIKANAITAQAISNYGNNLTIESVGTDSDSDGIVVAGAVESAAGSTTNLISKNGLDIQGAVSNSGTMVLNGTNVALGSISNSAGDLDISASTGPAGQVNIAGDVTNSDGTLDINAKSITIAGVLKNQSGTLNVIGSDSDTDSLSVGGINVAGGNLNLGALIGGVTVNGAVNVTDGNLNLDNTIKSFTAVGSVQVNGDFVFGTDGEQYVKDGNVFVAASGTPNFSLSVSGAEEGATSSLVIGGSIDASQQGANYLGTFAADTITVGGAVTAAGAGNKLVFGADASQQLTVKGAVTADAGASITFVSDDTDVGSINVDANSTLIAKGTQITAGKGAIDIAGGLWFGGSSPTPTTGLIVQKTNNLTLVSDTAQVEVGGNLSLGQGKTLNLSAVNSSVIANGDVSVGGILNANAQNVSMGDINNTGTTTLNATDAVSTGNIVASSGTVNITANGTGTQNVSVGGINVASGAVVNLTSGEALSIKSVSDIVVSGNLVQGSQSGALNLMAGNITVDSNAGLQLIGSYDAESGNAQMTFENAVSITENVNVAEGAEIVFNSAKFAATDIDNNGVLSVITDNGINLNLISNTGNLTLDSGTGITSVANFDAGSQGTIVLAGAGLTSADAFTNSGTILYQNYEGTLSDGLVNVASNNYTITANQFAVAGIEQLSGAMQVNASNIDITGNIIAGDLRFAKNSADNWIDATVGGNVSGGVDFWGIKDLNIGGNYVFNNSSDLWAAVMPYDESGAGNTSNKNYWATIEATEDNKKGEITNAENGQALISVGNQFVSNISGIVMGTADTAPQVGITLFDTVDQGTAIWLLHAENGIVIADEFEKLRNLDVQFCNADGTICIDYADTLQPANDGTYSDEGDLPIYISERDTDGDGIPDSLYVVFDPSFGGPVDIFKLQPIVAEVTSHTEGEYVSAGALDNLIAGQLQNTKFYNGTPIELIPQIFKGTNLEQMADELYDRMEYYNMTGERDPLARFSRLFQARELEQIAGSVALNEHTNFRDFEDRMFDEFIWNRNRSLKKAWLDIDYGMFFQNVSDGKHADGNRFSISGGFDWQNSETTILGLTARVSNSSSDNSDAMDLGYLPDTPVAGFVDIAVDDLNIGLGGYMMKTLGEKTRLYGNGFLDVHLFDVSRDQNFVNHIDGSGSAFSLITEWGLLHDWLNQYIVGNAYARVGYNFGFDVTERVDGQDYMNLKSDGYLILTPGYSLIAQKRIYPSAWFQIRPYASIGVEYDVLGAPDFVKYKFALAHTYTKYDVDIDPLWANIGGGIEFLSANGVQVGIDYRYQYNDAIQLHNIKISGSYRF